MPELVACVEALPPSVNHMYASGRNGQKFLRPEVHEWRGAVAAEIAANPDVRQFPRDARYALEMRVVFGNRRRQDIDNRFKAAADALCIALGIDDANIHEWHGYRDDGGKPSTLLILRTI